MLLDAPAQSHQKSGGFTQKLCGLSETIFILNTSQDIHIMHEYTQQIDF